jgi:hypothetical protein
MKYTDTLINELKSHDKLNYAGAVAFASLHNLPIRSVIAKISALGIPYTKKDPKTWGKTPEPTKDDYIELITEVVGDLPSLSRMTLPDLAKLKRAISVP